MISLCIAACAGRRGRSGLSQCSSRAYPQPDPQPTETSPACCRVIPIRALTTLLLFLGLPPRPLAPPSHPLSAVQRLHILRGVAYGLLTLHLSDLVHLDVMPANILHALLGSEIIVKLTDFSISWIVYPSSTFCAALTPPLCSATPAHLARSCLRSASWCSIKELVERLNRPFRPLPLSPLQSLAALLSVGVLPSSGP